MLNASVYLAGGINGLSDADASGWREEVKALLPATFTALDPMTRDYRGIEDANVAEIVGGDLADIERCDVVIANCARPSWGTAMEIHHASTAGIPVVVVGNGSVSPWLRFYSSAVVTTFAEAVDWVKSL